MFNYLKSLFVPGKRVNTLTHFVGHSFIYRDYETKNVSMEVRVERAEANNLQVLTTRHQPSGKSETSYIVNFQGEVQGNGPNTFGDAFGLPVVFWLSPHRRKPGMLIQFAGYPVEMTVLGEALWKEVRTCALSYEIVGQPANAQFELETGVLIGQTGTGYLAATSLEVSLPAL